MSSDRTSSTSTKAVGVVEPGGPEALEVIDLPEVQAGPGEIRIRVHAAAVNPVDTHRRRGTAVDPATESPPYVPGMDAAGIVDQIGDGAVTSLVVGDPVVCMVVPRGHHGAYRQQLVVPAAAVARAPAGVTMAEAATLPMNGLTARLTLDLLGLEPGQTLAVTGAAGCYGGYTVQLAKAEGLVVVADAAPHDEELVRSLGADLVVPRGDDVAVAIRARVPGGVDGLADGSVQNARVLDAVRTGGAVASVRRGWSPEAERGIEHHLVRVARYENDDDRLDRLCRQCEAGILTPRVDRTYPMTRAADAHRALEARGARGRQVILLV